MSSNIIRYHTKEYEVNTLKLVQTEGSTPLTKKYLLIYQNWTFNAKIRSPGLKEDNPDCW